MLGFLRNEDLDQASDVSSEPGDITKEQIAALLPLLPAQKFQWTMSEKKKVIKFATFCDALGRKPSESMLEIYTTTPKSEGGWPGLLRQLPRRSFDAIWQQAEKLAKEK